MEQNGIMVTVEQQCPNCCTKPFRWRSQPFILGRYPAGNILLSFATLMSGASISEVLLVFRHFGLAAYTSRTFFYHQRIFILPSILQYWGNYQANLVQSLNNCPQMHRPVLWKGFILHLTNGTQKCFVFHGLEHIVGKAISSFVYDKAVHLCTVNCDGFKDEISLDTCRAMFKIGSVQSCMIFKVMSAYVILV